MIAHANAQGIKVLLVDMTARSDSPDHGRVLQQLDAPVFVPELSDTDYFALDPIHLNVRGHQRFAGQIVGSIRALLSLQEAAQPQGPALLQTP